nr:reverse transcriptase domain-containing protein [Tanacetum cinerariifolium]
MVPATTPLIGFSGEIISPMGQMSLPVKIGEAEHSTSTWMNFVVVRSPSLYNGIIGRPKVKKIQAVPSTVHEMLKFLVPRGILTLRSSKIIPLECTMVLGPKAQPSAITRAAKERIKVAIHLEYPEQTTAIGSTLTEEGQKDLCDLFRHNLDILPADMNGVPRHIAEHRLNVREGCPPVRQKKRIQAPERNKEIQEEVDKLVDVGIIKEVHYHNWLLNPIMVKKHDNNWRICVDFKDLSKACPKYWATYQRLVDKAFQKQIGRNLEVYVDDLVIKSRIKQEIIRDIEETLKTLREINMKLNLKKCTFRMKEGIFMGYKVNTKGIKVCSDKVEVVLGLPSLKCLRTKAEWKISKSKQDKLVVYLEAAREAMSTVLMTKREAKQMPIYFVSCALQGLKIIYTPMEMLVLALVHARKRLKRAGGRYDIQYMPRISVKGQVLEDFIVEWPEDDSIAVPMEVEEELPEAWTLFTDRSSCIDGSGAGLIQQMGVKNLQTHVASRLVANQINGSYTANEPGMMQYLKKVKMLASNFKKFLIKQVSRSENKKAGTLSKNASTSFAHLTKKVLVEELKEKSINKAEVLAIMKE